MVLQAVIRGDDYGGFLFRVAKAYNTTSGALRREVDRWLKEDPRFREDWGAVTGKVVKAPVPLSEVRTTLPPLFREWYIRTHGNVRRTAELVGVWWVDLYNALRPDHPSYDSDLAQARAEGDEALRGQARGLYGEHLEAASEAAHRSGEARDHGIVGQMAARVLEAHDPAWTRKSQVDVTVHTPLAKEREMGELAADVFAAFAARLEEIRAAGVLAQPAPKCLPALQPAIEVKAARPAPAAAEVDREAVLTGAR